MDGSLYRLARERTFFAKIIRVSPCNIFLGTSVYLFIHSCVQKIINKPGYVKEFLQDCFPESMEK